MILYASVISFLIDMNPLQIFFINFFYLTNKYNFKNYFLCERKSGLGEEGDRLKLKKNII